jgi:hypothetical protein
MYNDPTLVVRYAKEKRAMSGTWNDAVSSGAHTFVMAVYAL